MVGVLHKHVTIGAEAFRGITRLCGRSYVECTVPVRPMSISPGLPAAMGLLKP